MAISIALQKLSSMLIISVFLLFFFFPSSLSNRCSSHESEALLHFKAGLNDSSGYLHSWVNGSDCCTNWSGISCHNLTNHVVSVEATGFFHGFQGVISESLCQLPFLTSLIIRGASGTTIPPCLGNLSHMQFLDLSNNSLSGMIPPSLCLLTLLTEVSLYSNNLNGSIPSCLCLLTRLTELDLSLNILNGSIPSCLCLLTRLTVLYLDGNKLNGRIPPCLGNLSALNTLSLYTNQISGSIPTSIGSLSLLQYLDLGYNQLSGTIPSSFSQLSSLSTLYADGNQLNETVSSASLPPSLVLLYLSLNHYQSISETFFHNHTSLNFLYLSDCVLNISTTWIPPFSLFDLYLVSCVIDSEFPAWISTQFSLRRLGLTNASLVGIIPSWLWETSPLLYHLNLSRNNLERSLSSNISIGVHVKELDVSRNDLSGHMPSMWPSNMTILLLNDNLFSGNIPSSLGKLPNLKLLDLANNHITGMIPVSLSNCSSLIVLNLGNNSLEGSLPHEISKLSELSSLVVHGNSLNGLFPSSIVNCSNLQVLDIGHNLFGGEIPRLITNLISLRMLVMKENKFTGSISLELGKLMNLQILLLSSNHLSGSIPHTIVSLQAMMNESQDGFILAINKFTYGITYQDGLDMISKGRDEHYPYILSTLTSIDLSNNELEGGITSDFGNLKGLRVLNLSMNNLNGTIPSSLGEMSQLESLDLSRNKFSGQIPPEFDYLNSLGFLNLSNNQLAGSIPQGRHITTFNVSSYLGNPNLWGCPLSTNCSWPQFVQPPPIPISQKKKSTRYPWYGIVMGLSFGVAFGGIVSLILIKMSWRRRYFNKVDTILKILFPWIKNMTL